MTGENREQRRKKAKGAKPVPNGLAGQRLIRVADLVGSRAHDVGLVVDTLDDLLSQMVDAGIDLATLDVMIAPAKLGDENGPDVLQIAAKAELRGAAPVEPSADERTGGE